MINNQAFMKNIMFWHACCLYLAGTILTLTNKGERIMKKFAAFAVAVLALVSVSGVFANNSSNTVSGSLNDSVATDTTVVQTSEEDAPAPATQEVAPADTVK